MYNRGQRIFSDIATIFTYKISKPSFAQKTLCRKSACNRLFATSPSHIKPFGTRSLVTSTTTDKVLVDLQKNKDLLEKNPHLRMHLQDYENGNKIKIDKKIEDCVGDVKILKEMGIPLENIYVLHNVPKAKLYRTIGYSSSTILAFTALYFVMKAKDYESIPLMFSYFCLVNSFMDVGEQIDIIKYGEKLEFVPVEYLLKND